MSRRRVAPPMSTVLRYVREEMIAGADEAKVMAGRERGTAAVATVRWRVWMRLLADGYSSKGIACRFNADHTSILWAKRQMALGRLPFDGAAVRSPEAKRPAKTGLIRWVGYDPTEQRLRAFA